MKGATASNGYISMLERDGSAPFERVRRRLVITMLLLGAIASLAALYLELIIEATNPVDLFFLPLMFVSFLGMGVALVYRRGRLQQFENAAYLILALYGFLMLVHQVRHTLPEMHTFTETMFWFPMLYLMAYLLHRRAMALRIAAGIWLTALLLGVFNTPFADLWRNRDANAFNSLVQFYISGIVYIMLLYVFSRIEEGYTQNRVLAYLDHLTQLPNRRYGEELLAQLLRERGDRDEAFSVIMLDLDGFKKVNDHHGHDVGDQVLKRCAVAIQNNLPLGARVIRWGGEEFLVILPDHDEAAACKVAEDVRRGLEATSHEGVGPVLASLGVAECRRGDTLDMLIQRADQAMYRAKQAGGNRVMAIAPKRQAVEA